MNKFLCFCFFGLLAFVHPNTSKIDHGMRYPSLSPDGKILTFSLHGDIWQVASSDGQATRLTLHKADDLKPRWSPDGKWIAFSSLRSGNFDIWLMPSSGGTATQITFHSDNDILCDWSADSQWLLFSSTRSGKQQIWKVAAAGGNPTLVTESQAVAACLSSDEQFVIYTNGQASLWQKGYFGSGNWDLYRLDLHTKKIQQVTKNLGNDLYPQLTKDNSSLYFVEETKTKYNLWQYSTANASKKLVKSFTAEINNIYLDSIIKGLISKYIPKRI